MLCTLVNIRSSFWKPTPNDLPPTHSHSRTDTQSDGYIWGCTVPGIGEQNAIAFRISFWLVSLKFRIRSFNRNINEGSISALSRERWRFNFQNAMWQPLFQCALRFGKQSRHPRSHWYSRAFTGSELERHTT